MNPELKTNIVKVLSANLKPMASSAILKALPVGGRPKSKALKEFLAQMERDGSRRLTVASGSQVQDRHAMRARG